MTKILPILVVILVLGVISISGCTDTNNLKVNAPENNTNVNGEFVEVKGTVDPNAALTIVVFQGNEMQNLRVLPHNGTFSEQTPLVLGENQILIQSLKDKNVYEVRLNVNRIS